MKLLQPDLKQQEGDLHAMGGSELLAKVIGDNRR